MINIEREEAKIQTSKLIALVDIRDTLSGIFVLLVGIMLFLAVLVGVAMTWWFGR